MTPERWKQIEALFHQARARPLKERAAFLADACGDDEPIRREVESLLDASGDGFLSDPAARLPGHLFSHEALVPMSGRTLGTYRLDALLGAGGMGEVYRAHDTKLGRDVAIKILPPGFTSNADRLARFEREARMLASLNHPNICAIHGLEEADGVTFLILEFVNGETLAQRIERDTTLPLADTLSISRQIADALEVAHERGIVHRDLKPANISITPDGVVKVLDFGLAKTVVGTGSSPDLSLAPDIDGARRAGAVVGTAAYMSPEQARGLPVDKRTDIWAFGCVLYEMLSGRAAFGGETASDSIAKVLEREPDWTLLPDTTPHSIRQLLRRCLSKVAKERLRDIGDARIEIDAVGRQQPPDESTAARSTPGRIWLLPSVIVLGLGAVAIRDAMITKTETIPDPFAEASILPLTDWAGWEALAEISPDGRQVVFLSDAAGEPDIWRMQLGSDGFENLTQTIPALNTPGMLRTFGFSGDGAQVWFAGTERPTMIVSQSGKPRPFLANDARALAWSPDGNHIAYFALDGERDPLMIADGTGSEARPLEITPSDPTEWSGVANSRAHNHNPAWSPDGQWLYFVHGVVRDWNDWSDEMDIWRVPAKGGSPERLTHLETAITFVTSLDARTLLYIAPLPDGLGSSLWSFDIPTRSTRRVVFSLEQFTSVSASRDGSRVVVTRANPTAGLWTVPILERESSEQDVKPYPVETKGSLAPRFGGASLFYLSARGVSDGLWRFSEGRSFELVKGADGMLLQSPAPSRDGRRVAIIRKRDHKHRLTVMQADGTESRTVAPTLDVYGMADWSPDSQWIVTGGIDAAGRPGLFKIAVGTDAAAEPVRIAGGEAINPIWSDDGKMIVYAGAFVRGQAMLSAVRPDTTPLPLPLPRVSPGGYRFLRDGRLVYLPRPESSDFWLFDFQTGKSRQFTRLAHQGTIRRFDITPDGGHIIFDRVQQHSDVVLIELPGRSRK